MNFNVRNFEISGTSYEIGCQLGRMAAGNEKLAETFLGVPDAFSEAQGAEMITVFDTYCPGMNEELQGFADTLGVPRLQLVYYTMAYLTPGCSQLAVLPEHTADGHVLLARNYEFSHLMEDFAFCKTQVEGKYMHMGCISMHFGRSEGINDQGLAVSQTSCGMPVGNIKGARKPAVIGLQFNAVIRTLLENCKDVSEALNYLKGMPIGYNINLILVDSSGTAVLFETLDGKSATHKMEQNTGKAYLHSTNHVHLPQLAVIEPLAMKNSKYRYQLIQKYLAKQQVVSRENLKKLLITKYPEGLCCHYYQEFFGTIRSLVFDVTAGTVEICWGGLETNGWNSYRLSDDVKPMIQQFEIELDTPEADFFEFV